VLAGELAAAGGDHRTGFTRYEQVMRPYVTRAQQLPPGGIDGFAPRSQAMIRLRAASMTMLTRWPLRALMAGQFSKAGDIDLPDYELAGNPSGSGAGGRGGLAGDRLQ
jgi:hypothetical protein